MQPLGYAIESTSILVRNPPGKHALTAYLLLMPHPELCFIFHSQSLISTVSNTEITTSDSETLPIRYQHRGCQCYMNNQCLLRHTAMDISVTQITNTSQCTPPQMSVLYNNQHLLRHINWNFNNESLTCC